MKGEIMNMNIPSLTVTDAKKTLERMYSNAISKGVPLHKLPTPFYWGPPGVGKSQSVYQLAKDIEKETGKRAIVTDVRLLLFSPVDLRGVPVADEHREFTNWLMPKIFDMDKDEECINILFLDELSAAPQSVQAAAYQICLDKKIGEHKLPDNCIVIAAGNRTTDQSVSYKMPKALCNRLMHFNIISDYASWRDWAVSSKISDKVIAYLGFDNSRLYIEPESSELAYPTPRSWEFVSTLLRTMSDNPSEIHHLIAACIGESTAIEFEQYCKGLLDMPDVNEIMHGTCKEYPKSHDVLYALISNIVSIFQKRCDELTIDEIDNVCKYVIRFPKDFAITFMSDVQKIEAVNKKMMKCKGFQLWMSKNKNLL